MPLELASGATEHRGTIVLGRQLRRNRSNVALFSDPEKRRCNTGAIDTMLHTRFPSRDNVSSRSSQEWITQRLFHPFDTTTRRTRKLWFLHFFFFFLSFLEPVSSELDFQQENFRMKYRRMLRGILRPALRTGKSPIIASKPHSRLIRN